MDTSVDYRNVNLLVRSSRVAILIPETDPYWKHIILQIIQWCSQVWGGAYFLIVPTDGTAIKDVFWDILEDYSPDHVLSYRPTLHDIEIADNESHQMIIAGYKDNFTKQFPELGEQEFRDIFERDLRFRIRGDFSIEDHLQLEIKHRLAPFLAIDASNSK